LPDVRHAPMATKFYVSEQFRDVHRSGLLSLSLAPLASSRLLILQTYLCYAKTSWWSAHPISSRSCSSAVNSGACFERVEDKSVLGNCLAAHPTFLDQW